MRGARVRSIARAPGLPPTGKTYPTPRNSILPLTGFPVLLDQRFAIDPCLPSFALCSAGVTSLEPRTPHQPEKPKKLPKNDLVVLLLFFQSIKSVGLYLIYFHCSACRPQACDRIWCMALGLFLAKARSVARFALRAARATIGTAQFACPLPVNIF